MHFVSLCPLVLHFIPTPFQRNPSLILEYIFPERETVVNGHTYFKGLIQLQFFTRCQCLNILFVIKFYFGVPYTVRDARQCRVLLESCGG